MHGTDVCNDINIPLPGIICFITNAKMVKRAKRDSPTAAFTMCNVMQCTIQDPYRTCAHFVSEAEQRLSAVDDCLKLVSRVMMMVMD